MGSGQHSESDQTSRVGAPVVSEVSAPPLAWASPKVPPTFPDSSSLILEEK